MVRSVLVVDAANVVGSVPNGWWKDRAGAARRLHERLLVADTSYDEIVVVLEGQAKQGVRPGRDGHVRTIHASRDGDSAIATAVSAAVASDARVVLVTADRELARRGEVLGARTMSPSWLLDQLAER